MPKVLLAALIALVLVTNSNLALASTPPPPRDTSPIQQLANNSSKRETKMPNIAVRRIIDAPVEKVWASWDDFGGIYKFHPALKSSHLLTGSPASGIGCRRQCNLKDGKNWVHEQIIEYDRERSLRVDIIEGTMPLKKAEALIQFQPLSTQQTEITFTMNFLPRFGFFGRLMAPMMKAQFQKMLTAVLAANDTFVTQGKSLNSASK